MDTVIGVDVGGTFTDFVAFGAEGVRAWKVPSTPAAPEDAVLAGLGGVRDARIVHGSTVSTNALLERRGPRTVLVTTAGFKDMLEIRRQVRPAIYDLEPRRRPHVVRRGDVVAAAERIGVEGDVIEPLREDEVRRIVQAAAASGGETFAVSLLFSYVEPAHERRIVAALRATGLDACASFEVGPEHREYERASTTAVNAFLRPAVRRYLGALGESLPALRVMHSAGGLTTPSAAAGLPVTMVLSGPAGGAIGAAAVARQAGFARAVTFDMGGTSTDVSLVDGDVPFRLGSEIDGLVVNTPMVDVVTIGAGGGSIARLDAGGAIVVGPESAGADPGPACYGAGTQPTVSDANLVLGRLRSEQPLAGSLVLQPARAWAALAAIGDGEEAARAVVAVVNANMARAVRRVSLERGFDPAEFVLVAFGGAGPLHACDVADAVGIPRVLVPRYPGVLSALGMAVAPEVVERGRGLVVELGDPGAPGRLAACAEGLAAEVRAEFAALAGPVAPAIAWHADARYAGQAHELRVAAAEPTPAALAAAFHAAHERRFGFSAGDRPVELVALRCRASGPARGLPAHPIPGSNRPGAAGARPPERPPEGVAGAIRRESLEVGATLIGPVVVTQDDATTFVPAGWQGMVDDFANLVLERSP